MTGFMGAVIGIALGILSLNLLAGKRKEKQSKFDFTPPPDVRGGREHDDELSRRGAAMSSLR